MKKGFQIGGPTGYQHGHFRFDYEENGEASGVGGKGETDEET